jgi:hypothetical protein
MWDLAPLTRMNNDASLSRAQSLLEQALKLLSQGKAEEAEALTRTALDIVKATR